MTIPFDLDAPIMAGKSAAGVNLGDEISTILEWAKPTVITSLEQGWRYHFASVHLWVDAESKITQIGLYSGYRGKIANTIGIGSTLGKVTSTIGAVVEDEEDNLIALGLPGCCFETDQWRHQENDSPDLATKITGIYIFTEP